MCDDERYDRQKNNTNMVYRFGIRINENVKVLDQSLIHWKWLDVAENIEINTADLWIDTNFFSQIDKDKMQETIQAWTTFDTSSAEEQYKWIERFKLANFGIIPYYEDNIDHEWEIPYVEIWCLTWEDPVKIYKKYEDINWDVLENWDKVQVTIVLKAKKNFTWTFIDKISWPWIIPLTGEME